MTLEELMKMRPSLATTEVTFRYAQCAKNDPSGGPDTAVIVVHVSSCCNSKDKENVFPLRVIDDGCKMA